MYSFLLTIAFILVEQHTIAVSVSGETVHNKDGKSVEVTDRNNTLRLVHLLFRHGDRTPCNFYPTDPYKDESLWPAAPGQLTPRGKMMHFKLGQWIRKRYSGFLSEKYNPDEIKVRSTDIDRTLMSAMSNLAGLYPPEGSDIWNVGLPWQPIPVHTVPLEEDLLLSNRATDCPRKYELLAAVDQSEEVQKMYADNKQLMTYISENSGREVKSLTDMDYLYDTLLVESIYNFSLPAWTESIFPGGAFKKLRDLSFKVSSYTHELKRLSGGPFLNTLASHWKDFISGDDDLKDRKVFMYSAHDSTISMLLNTLSIYNDIPPPYASLVMFELHQNRKQEWIIRILYRNSTVNPPYALSIPNCSQDCPLDDFLKLTENVRPKNREQECLSNPPDSDNSISANDEKVKVEAKTFHLTISIVFFSVFGIFAIAAYTYRYRTRPNYESI